jgi:hypothetical protein
LYFLQKQPDSAAAQLMQYDVASASDKIIGTV